MRFFLSVGLASTLVIVATITRAEACSPPPCWPDAALVPADGTTVPANLPALYWRAVDSSRNPNGVDPSKLWLAEVGGAVLVFTPKKLGYDAYQLTLPKALVPGKTYRFVDATVCSGWGSADAGLVPDVGSGPPEPGVLDLRFKAGPAAALPKTLGTLKSKSLGRSTLTVGTSSGSCSTDIEADRVQIDLELSVEAKPWSAVLHFETRVDGKRWFASESINSVYPPGAGWRGRGADMLYAVCKKGKWGSPFPGVKPGSHQVMFQATLPGTTIKISTPPITVTLSCPGQPGDGGPADGTASRDFAASEGLPTPDTGLGDAGRGSDAGPVPPARSSGCAVSGPPDGDVLLGLFLLGLGLLGRRRRAIAPRL